MSASNKFSWIYVPTKNVSEARRIARILLKEKLAACANIVPEMESLYFWKGKIVSGREALLLLKTKSINFSKVSRRIELLHSYKVPCVAALSVTKVNKIYGEWLLKESQV